MQIIECSVCSQFRCICISNLRKHLHVLTSEIEFQVSCYNKVYKENCSVQTNGHTFSTVINNLGHDSDYELKVAAWTQAGLGVWSKTFLFGKCWNIFWVTHTSVTFNVGPRFQVSSLGSWCLYYTFWYFTLWHIYQWVSFSSMFPGMRFFVVNILVLINVDSVLINFNQQQMISSFRVNSAIFHFIFFSFLQRSVHRKHVFGLAI